MAWKASAAWIALWLFFLIGSLTKTVLIRHKRSSTLLSRQALTQSSQASW
jgi:hypothetical protein